MRTMWGYNYEQIKFLKVTFKFWLYDTYPKLEVTWGDTVQDVRGTGRQKQLRYSYDPDCRGRHMTADNIQLRRNAKHIVGARLNRPWFFRVRPVFTGQNVNKIQVGYNPWFDCPGILNSKNPFPAPRNAYLYDFINAFRDIWNTNEMFRSLPQEDAAGHNILYDFDSSESFDVPDFNACPLESM
ncbi:hypothetical protein LSAT2_011126, partial [Lamellibrachia satsuma]